MWGAIAMAIASAYSSYQANGGKGSFMSAGDFMSTKAESGAGTVMPVLDGSGWTVATGKSNATGATQTSAPPSVLPSLVNPGGAGGANVLMLTALGLGAYLVLKG